MPPDDAGQLDRSTLPWREAVRAVVLDPDHRILLVHFDFVAPDIPNGFWSCPGGGKNPDERDDIALRRELREEVGLEVGHLGPPIWDKNYTWPAGPFSGQHDVYYLVETDPFEPVGLFDAGALKAEHVDGIRWWSWNELQSTAARFADAEPSTPGYTVFSPRSIVTLLRDLHAYGRPDEPVILLDR